MFDRITQKLESIPAGMYIWIGIIILCVQAIVLFMFGQPPICTCGYIQLWHGTVLDSGNSQHLSDWYTLSHIVHGFIFYAILWILFPRMKFSARFILAIGIESSWEILENTPMVIRHYRQQALAQGYMGDSIINSISDTCAMIGGFFVARKLPVLAIIALGLFLELLAAYAIRDNLSLNILNLIHVFPAVSHWQQA